MVQEQAKKIIQMAVEQGVYDVTFQYSGKSYCIYFKGNARRDCIKEVNQAEGHALIAHFKFIAGMNVGEKRRVQLGSCWYNYDSDKQRRLRLSTVGDFDGNESLVIRLLHDKQQKLSFWFDAQDRLDRLSVGRGLHLFAGPVGSGKTSLMFDIAAREFADQQILTVEVPVELVNSNFIQLQVNQVIGNDYDALIKLSLRHRPELLIVGEIRDSKTAHAVLQASLTGYTVFSTVHARSVQGVWARLVELGLSKEELDNSLQSVIYQRLIGGKGVIEIAQSQFASWQNQRWNEKMQNLFEEGHLTHTQLQKEKIKSIAPSKINSIDE